MNYELCKVFAAQSKVGLYRKKRTAFTAVRAEAQRSRNQTKSNDESKPEGLAPCFVQRINIRKQLIAESRLACSQGRLGAWFEGRLVWS